MFKRTIKAGLAKLGFELRRLPKMDAGVPLRIGENPLVDLQHLFSNKEPMVIFDVGAHYGQTAAKFRRFFPQAVIHAFEPFPQSFAKLEESFARDPAIIPVAKAMDEDNGRATLFVNRADYTNSLLECDLAANPWVPGETTRTLGEIQVETCTVERYCSEQGLDQVNILKTDTQGAELRVLKGAVKLLTERRVDALYLEVIFAPLYEGQANFCQLLDYLTTVGYRLVSIYDLYRGNNGFAGWADALFIREDYPMPSEFLGRHNLN
ncbi:MAG: FkbM family methyltransferase [Gammaproteobacteria bacterium]|nr:FkbM family methyltransferase [Gammaproteobacteria bacterium]